MSIELLPVTQNCDILNKGIVIKKIRRAVTAPFAGYKFENFLIEGGDTDGKFVERGTYIRCQ